MSLDERLTEILTKDYIPLGEDGNNGWVLDDDSLPEAIDQIKAAFEAEGWRDSTYVGHVTKTTEDALVSRMTGQEWYGRFVGELDKSGHSYEHLLRNDVLEAAEKAAGIE